MDYRETLSVFVGVLIALVGQSFPFSFILLISLLVIVAHAFYTTVKEGPLNLSFGMPAGEQARF